MKICSKCSIQKPISSFGKISKGKDGLNSKCRECCAADMSNWRLKNKEKYDKHRAEYNLANIEKQKEYRKKYKSDNAERIKSYNARYRKENKDKIKSNSIKYYEENRDRIKLSCAKYYAENKDKATAASIRWQSRNKDKIRIYSQNRRYRKIENGGKLSHDLAERLFKLQRGKCPCCGENLGNDYHLDHIIPLKLGGSNEDSNIQLLRSSCNHKKQARHPIEYMQSRGFLL